ncbi:hypothetical protein GHT06_022470 [Daphnia sinensis]|uniref:Uncharacterized protein n=1 Tax=Daphnia sinensis TaxID=1820382 RepID=A0AAD5PNQ5_9CRUS|nr:hypothetical protein GHT06_022470 [Daphnia sinensis]
MRRRLESLGFFCVYFFIFFFSREGVPCLFFFVCLCVCFSILIIIILAKILQNYSCCSSYLSLNEKRQHLFANWYRKSSFFFFTKHPLSLMVIIKIAKYDLASPRISCR